MIIDDDELDRLVLQHYIKQYENIEIVASFDSAEKAIPYLELPIDLLITETNLKGMSGLEFRKLAHKIPACIFVSSIRSWQPVFLKSIHWILLQNLSLQNVFIILCRDFEFSE
jgi:DNA-binding NarL/FixJ family response regulator